VKEHPVVGRTSEEPEAESLSREERILGEFEGADAFVFLKDAIEAEDRRIPTPCAENLGNQHCDEECDPKSTSSGHDEEIDVIGGFGSPVRCGSRNGDDANPRTRRRESAANGTG